MWPFNDGLKPPGTPVFEGVCVCVCVNVCMRAYMCVHVYVCVHVDISNQFHNSPGII